MRGCVGVSAAASVMVPAPERIQLEICRRNSKEELQEELEEEEVSEEILNRFNLSGEHPVQIRCRSEPYRGPRETKTLKFLFSSSN